ncbi:MAG: DNA-binding MarR family transcriptional regulator [Desulforhopalus sp.]|jgi:DNA-binding MarR family transcriptional regulator
MLTKQTKLWANYSMVNAVVSKKLDNQLSAHGINFSEFMILFHLDHTKDKMMRRIDLAEKIGLSASGITRLVSPMEKIGLVQKERNTRDARVSLVKISSVGQRILKDSSVSLNEASKDALSILDQKRINEMLKTLILLGGNLKS